MIMAPWAQTARQYQTLWKLRKVTVGGVAEKMAALRGDAPFCLFEGERISFREFNRRANRRANFFAGRGVTRGDVVCLMMENRPEFLETLVGLSKLGAVTAGINFNLQGESLAHTINLSGARRIVVGTECLAHFNSALPVLEGIGADGTFVDSRWEGSAPAPPGSHDLTAALPEAGEENPPRLGLRGSDTVLYNYTSGTTGLPKATPISHRRWFSAGFSLVTNLAIKPDDCVYCPLPLYHSNGTLLAFAGPLVGGATMALTRRFSASRFWEEMHANGVTCFIYIGELLRYLINTPTGPYDRNHRVTRIMGNGLRGDIWKAFQERFGVRDIREFYASTEGNLSLINLDNVPGSVGKPSPARPLNMVLVRYDPQSDSHPTDERGFLIRCETGEPGEMLGKVTRLTPFIGYTDPGETEKKLLRNVFKRGDAYFRTGDLFRQDERGYYYFLDRVGDTFRWKGENVSTEELQKVISAFDGIAVVNAYGVAVPRTEGRAGMAALTLHRKWESDKAAFDPEAFYRFVTERLASYARPAFVRICSEVEVTATFKLRKPDLQREGFDPGRVSDPLFFRDDGEEMYRPLDDRALERINAGEIRF